MRKQNDLFLFIEEFLSIDFIFNFEDFIVHDTTLIASVKPKIFY
jgi:hypothetical protein